MRFSPKKLLTSVGAGATFSLLCAQSAMAQTLGEESATVGNLGQIKGLNPSSNTNLMATITTIVNYLLVIVGILAVIYLIYGGVLYLTAGGDAEKAGKGRVAITNAIIGIIIILLSLAIYNFVIDNVG